MIITHFRITNLTCEACVKISKMALEEIESVSEVNVDLKTGAVELISTEAIEWGRIYSELESLGKNAIKLQ